jgi:hypothetical protein
MSTRTFGNYIRLCGLIVALTIWPFASHAQVAVAEVEQIDNLQKVSASELETLVGPIALYPDDLLAIVLPASTFPLQIVEAQRFLQDLENDPSLEPDEDWNDAVVALVNYPEVVDLLNEDLDWMWQLGEAVAVQQEDVIAAIETFRDRAYAAGNLKSDDYQIVAQEGDTIQITPVQEDVIYVPYYEPERVVVYQPRPAYYYYPQAYPVYYYPYPEYHPFYNSYFWGVTTAFSIGWHSHHLNVYHPSYYGHPYYGRSYWDYGWYRRPSINVYNTVYVNNNNGRSNNRYRDGDHWQSNKRRPVRASDQSITRSRYYPNSNTQGSSGANSLASSGRSGSARNSARLEGARDDRQDIQFRERSRARAPVATRSASQPRQSTGQNSRQQQTTRQPESNRAQARPPATTRQPKVKPTDLKQLQSRPSTTIRKSQFKPSTTRQTQATTTRQPQVRATAPKTAQTRSTPQPRQSAPKAASQRQSAPRVLTQRQSTPKVSSQRQSSPRVSTQRQSSPRVSTQRQSAPKAASQRQSAPKVASSGQPSRSSSSNSSRYSSGNSGRASSNSTRKSDRRK